MTELILVECAWEEKSDVASWLIATAASKGISTKLIQTRNEGFLVPVAVLEGVTLGYTVTQTVTPAPAADPLFLEDENYGVPVPVTATVDPDRETVRAWAKEQGLEVADKGRLAGRITQAYIDAHS